MKNLETIPWKETIEILNTKGHSLIKNALTKSECEELIATYDQSQLFRKTIQMARYRFGSGEYKYFNYPLPPLLESLRSEIYQQLMPVANQWMNLLKTGINYPAKHSEFIDQCNAADQLRPTPLILRYGVGDFNTLHQDLYGEIYFPFQAILFLNKKEVDYSGGELVLTEQVPRAQSKATVISPDQGDMVVLTTQLRPKKGTKGYYRINMRHGVSEVTSGKRHTVGIIFHDAK